MKRKEKKEERSKEKMIKLRETEQNETYLLSQPTQNNQLFLKYLSSLNPALSSPLRSRLYLS